MRQTPGDEGAKTRCEWRAPGLSPVGPMLQFGAFADLPRSVWPHQTVFIRDWRDARSVLPGQGRPRRLPPLLQLPVPAEAELANTVSSRYAFLADLNAEERQLAQAREQDRGLALDLLAKLPGARLAHVGLY